MSSEADSVIEEINDEIKKAKAEPEEFQIEITDDPQEEVNDIVEEETKEAKKKPEPDPEYGEKVQKRRSEERRVGKECRTRWAPYQ